MTELRSSQTAQRAVIRVGWRRDRNGKDNVDDVLRVLITQGIMELRWKTKGAKYEPCTFDCLTPQYAQTELELTVNQLLLGLSQHQSESTLRLKNVCPDLVLMLLSY